MYNLLVDGASLIWWSPSATPFLGICIDFKRGLHVPDMAECFGLIIYVPSVVTGIDTRAIT